MINLHTIENALLTLSFDYSIIRHATKCVDAWNQDSQPDYIPVVSGDVSLCRAPSGDCFVTIRQIADTGEFEDVEVYVPVQGSSEEPYICKRAIVGRCGL